VGRIELTRRKLLQGGLGTLGLAALSDLALRDEPARADGLPGFPNFPAKAKRVIYLFASGGPSQLDLFDYKPKLSALDGTNLPDSVRGGQRLTTMTSTQDGLPIQSSMFKFSQAGQSGAWVSELLPNIAGVVDKLVILNATYTDQINHDPAATLMQTGYNLPGRPSFGSWVSYALGGLSDDLPTFVVMVAKNTSPDPQPLYTRLWGSGFLPATHQATQFRSSGDPVLFLKDGIGTSSASDARMRGLRGALDKLHRADVGDPEIDARVAAYELAARMQLSVPTVTDLSKEPDSTFQLYGPDSRTPGTHAANCLLARRLIENGVRFVQLYHRDWDHHSSLPDRIRNVARENDQGTAALITDLAQRGLLEDTVVIWGGEFGRTVFSQGKPTNGEYGRDHHPRCFTTLLAGGGFKQGLVYGQTDDFSYNVVEGGVHVHDLHATVLNRLGIDHTKLTFRAQGRDFRLTDIAGTVVDDICA
jgi:hypothetical protein